MEFGKDDVTIFILLVGEASGVFAGFCPSWFTVSSPFFHEQSAKEGNVKRIRWGEAAATAIVVASGWAVSYRTGKWSMLWVSMAISAIFVGGYEFMIAHPSKEGNAQAPTKLPQAGSTNSGLFAMRPRA